MAGLGDDDDKIQETEALSYRKEDRIHFAEGQTTYPTRYGSRNSDLDTLWGRRKLFSHPHFCAEPQISATPSGYKPAFAPTYLHLPTFGFHAFC